MRVEVECPECSTRVLLSPGTEAVCERCGRRFEPRDSLEPGAALTDCLVCGDQRLYRQRDFNRKVGVTIILGSAAVSLALLPFSATAAYGVLFGLAAIDLALYRRLPEIAICYRCGARYRKFPTQSKLEPFDLLTAEIVDQQVREGGLQRIPDSPP